MLTLHPDAENEIVDLGLNGKWVAVTGGTAGHGAAYATFGRVRREHFRWLSGEDRLRAYRADNGTVRRFCADCGSSLSFAPANDDGRYVEVALGTLDGELEQRPDAHIFIGSKANWVEPCDGLPQYVEDRRGPRADG